MFIKKNYHRAVCLFLSILFLLCVKPAEVFASDYWPDGPVTESPNVILLEPSTGTILYEKDSMEAHYPASITKIMTVLLALENSELNEVVTFSDASIDETEGSGIARDYGEQMTMEQCLYAIMLESANECAYAVAEHVGGTMENFVDMMNAKASELGCVNTHFENPHGLHNENHYTCSYDMAIIARAAYENETFRIITGTARYVIPPTNKHEEPTNLQNHNELLYPRQCRYVYEYCVGGKTGYTNAANSTLVTYAEKDGMTLICVVMNTQSPSQWTDSTSLFDFGFDNFQLVNIAENETDYETPAAMNTGTANGNRAFVDIDRNASIVLPKAAEFSDAVSEITYEGVDLDTVGTISYTYAGHAVGGADIVTTGVEIQGFVFDNQKEADANPGEGHGEGNVSTVRIKPLTIVLIIAVVLLLVILAVLIKLMLDNFYIIRHNIEVRRGRREQFKIVRNRNRRNKRRR